MPKQDETLLYSPVKRLLEERGYEVKGEVQGCDVVGVRGEEVVIVELKAAMNLTLVLQGVDRLRLSQTVYLAIPAPSRGRPHRWPEVVRLCRRLGLGLLTVHRAGQEGAWVEVVADPEPYKPREAAARRTRLLGEFGRRSGDHNLGGSSKRRLVTAYRERALRLAAALDGCAGSRVRDLRAATGCEDAGSILRDNYYGWFVREERGVYGLTPAGMSALAEFGEVLAEARPAAPPDSRGGYHQR